jgi:hypothetical protein
MSAEKNTFQNHERGFDAEQLKDTGNERRHELAQERERSAETSERENTERARHEALELASSAEKAHKTHEKAPAEKRGVISKRERKASFDSTMTEVRTHMSGPSRAFSSVIHQPLVEKVSDAIGNTVARPNAVLSGSLIAFLFTLGLYLIARFNGYALSGTETIAAFILGWLIGVGYDYLRLIITGKR